jgi:hypothetical protein
VFPSSWSQVPASLLRKQTEATLNVEAIQTLRECIEISRELSNLENLLGIGEVSSDLSRPITDSYKHRFIALGLQAYWRDEISYGKLKVLFQLIGLPEFLANIESGIWRAGP